MADEDCAPAIVRLCEYCDTSNLVLPLLEAVSVGSSFVGVYDENDYLRYANDSFLDAFGLQAGEVATFSSIIVDAARSGKTLRIEAADTLAFIADAQLRRRGEAQAPRQRSFPVDFIDGKWFWCIETLLPSGWIVLIGADITSMKRTESLLSAERDRALLLSGVDELTGIPNRRFALAHLDSLLDAFSEERESRSLCVALLDLDHFKSINDTFGHETGDTALRQFAQHCIAVVRPPKAIGRLGGEEFLLVFPDASLAQAKAALDEMLVSMPPVASRLPAHVEITLSFSAGVAQALAGESRDDLMRRADRALYVAKERGRSRVELSEPRSARRSPYDRATGQ